MIRAGAELILRFLRFPYPVMTVCAGHAYPMGAFLMLSADARLGITGPWKIGLNEVAIAMTVPKFAVELARHRLTPPAFSKVNTGYLFDPEGATLAGYFDCVVDRDKLDECIAETSLRLKQLDMASFKATKERVNGQAIAAIESALNEEFAEMVSA